MMPHSPTMSPSLPSRRSDLATPSPRLPGSEKPSTPPDTPSPTSTVVPTKPLSKESHEPSPSFPPLRQTSTSLTSASAREAARKLQNFSTSPANARNWSASAKWRTSITVAVTGFISTCGSSIGVAGIHAVMDEFGVTNEKIGVLITTFYVLGLG